MNFDLASRTILLTRSGSRAYGTNRLDSDVDVRGVCIAPRHIRDGFLHHFEQAQGLDTAGFSPLLNAEEQAIVKTTHLDGCVYSLPKFMALAADCNPNILDVLFVADQDVLLETPVGAVLRNRRQEFLSKKALYTFSGYAHSQLKRIETHRRWLLDPHDHQPTRAEFGLPPTPEIPSEQLNTALTCMRAKVDTWSLDFGDLDEAFKIYVQEQIALYLAELDIAVDEVWRRAGVLLGYGDDLLELLRKERKYKEAHTDWEKYETWKRGRNPARAALEAHYGYDTKHGMHLVRLMTMCREILTDGTVNVRRPDARFLLGIRDGAWPYDQLLEWATAQDRELAELALLSTLPRGPDRVALNGLCIDLTAMLGD